MKETFAKIEELIDNAREYVDVSIESAKLSFAETCSAIVSHALAVFIITMMILFFVLFSSIALSVFLNECTGSAWLGFLIVAFLHLLLGSIVWISKERFIRLPIMNALIKKLFKKNEEN